MADPYRYFRIEARELTDELSAGLGSLVRGAPTSAAVASLLRHAHTLKGAARVMSQSTIADAAHALEALLGPYRGSAETIEPTLLARMQAVVDDISNALGQLAAEPPPGGGTASVATVATGASGATVTSVATGDSVASVATGETVATVASGDAVTSVATGDSVASVATGETVATVASGDTVATVATGPAGETVATVATAATGATVATVVIPAPAAAPQAEYGVETTAADLGEDQLERIARVSLAEIEDVLGGVSQALTQVRALQDCSTRLTALRVAMSIPAGPLPGDLMLKVAKLERDTDDVQRSVNAVAERIDRELREVHEVAERLRLVPVSSIGPDLERAARDVATAQDKRVLVDVAGGDLRLDAPVLAAAQLALRQIVRNAVAHGIESPAARIAAGKAPEGRVRLQVTQSGGRVRFRCDDDGRGIDLAAVRGQLRQNGEPEVDSASDDQVLELLMRGGVSTASELSEVSGRGIGLDVVQDAARRLGGGIRISTRPGAGTTIELTVRGSLTAQDVLIVQAGERLALPLRSVSTTVRVSADQISRSATGETLVHEGRTIPFLPLSAALSTLPQTSGPASGQTSGQDDLFWSAMVLQTPSGTAAIGVDRLIGAAEISIRALPELAPVSPVVAGVWMDADGRPRLVLDPDAVVATATRRRALDVTPASTRAPILVVDDSLTTRMLEQSILESAGYQVELAASAEEGLAMASKRPYCLVLVDVEMPGMDGFAFIEQTRARAELRHLPCILVTTRSSPADRQRGADAGARGHIDKGEFHQGLLLTRISELLAG